MIILSFITNNLPEIVDMVRLWFPRTNSDGRKVGSSTTSKPKSESISSESLSFPLMGIALSAEPVCTSAVIIGTGIAWFAWLGAFNGGGSGGGGGPAATF